MGRNFISYLGVAVAVLLLGALASLCLFDPYSTVKDILAVAVLSLLCLGCVIVLLLVFSRPAHKLDK